jgi:nucleotide-binding universal stress UspA family protein
MKKILVAYDGSEPADRALEQTAELAAALDGRVTVVSVVPRRRGRVSHDPWDDAAIHAEALAHARTFLATRQLEWALLQPHGDPGKVIAKLADEGGYDIVVVGSRGHDVARRALFGSVSGYVASHTRSTVVIVH